MNDRIDVALSADELEWLTAERRKRRMTLNGVVIAIIREQMDENPLSKEPVFSISIEEWRRINGAPNGSA